ncbi:MAG: hypothetical protein AAGJ81_16255 [Verrucomicrobiota bacterium]
MIPIQHTYPCVIAYEFETGTALDGSPVPKNATEEEIREAACRLLDPELPADLYCNLAEATFIYYTPAGMPGWSFRLEEDETIPATA